MRTRLLSSIIISEQKSSQHIQRDRPIPIFHNISTILRCLLPRSLSREPSVQPFRKGLTHQPRKRSTQNMAQKCSVNNSSVSRESHGTIVSNLPSKEFHANASRCRCKRSSESSPQSPGESDTGRSFLENTSFSVFKRLRHSIQSITRRYVRFHLFHSMQKRSRVVLSYRVMAARPTPRARRTTRRWLREEAAHRATFQLCTFLTLQDVDLAFSFTQGDVRVDPLVSMRKPTFQKKSKSGFEAPCRCLRVSPRPLRFRYHVGRRRGKKGREMDESRKVIFFPLRKTYRLDCT